MRFSRRVFLLSGLAVLCLTLSLAGINYHRLLTSITSVADVTDSKAHPSMPIVQALPVSIASAPLPPPPPPPPPPPTRSSCIVNEPFEKPFEQPACVSDSCDEKTAYLDVVVARHDEGTAAWLPDIVSELQKYPAVVTGGARLFIYIKGNRNIELAEIKRIWTLGPIYVRPLPNVGREGHTYFSHLVLKWESKDFADYTVFLQGAAEEVKDTILPMLEATFTNPNVRLAFAREGTCECTGCNGYWSPEMMRVYYMVIGRICDAPFMHAMRNQFIVSKKAILDGRYEWYYKVVQISAYPQCHPTHLLRPNSVGPDWHSTPSGTHVAHAMERLGGVLFGCIDTDLPRFHTSTGKVVRICPEGRETYKYKTKPASKALPTPDWYQERYQRIATLDDNF